MRKTVELGRRGCPGAPEGQNHGEGVLEGRPGLLGKQEAGRSQRKLSTWQGSPGTLPDSGERWEPNDDGVKEGRRLSTSEQSRVSSYYHPRDLQGLGSRGRGGCFSWGGGGVAFRCPHPAGEEHSSLPPPGPAAYPYLSRARARAGMLRSRSRPTAQRGVTSELRGSNSDEARGPGRAVRSRLGVLIEGGVSTAAQTRSRARAPSASGFRRCAWLPQLRSGSAPAAALGGAETPAMRRKPGADLERTVLWPGAGWDAGQEMGWRGAGESGAAVGGEVGAAGWPLALQMRPLPLSPVGSGTEGGEMS